jgi:peptidyl-tRNA hydrolase
METELVPETSIPMPAPLEEELRVYLVVNTDLKMSLGKTVVQTGHAVEYLLDKRDELLARCDMWHEMVAASYIENLWPSVDDLCWKRAFAFNRWKNQSHCKISLGANTAEFNAVKDENPDTHVVVVDAGRTEIAPGSETVVGLFPMKKSERSKTLKTLKLL